MIREELSRQETMTSLIARRWILPSIQEAFSEFLEDIDVRSFESDLWNGKITLKNVRFKPGLLETLDVVPAGYYIPESNVAVVEISVPWTKLSEESTIVTIRDVDVLVVRKKEHERRSEMATSKPSLDPSPNARDETFISDAAAVSGTAWSFKQRYIDIVMHVLLKRFQNISPQWNAARVSVKSHASRSGSTSLDEEWESAGTMGRMALRVLDNMQLDIKNVHIRFEDYMSSPSKPFAMGIFCKKLSLFTTNANFKKAIRDRGISKQEYTHKKAVCQKLGVYWASNPDEFLSQSIYVSSQPVRRMPPNQLKKCLANVIHGITNKNSSPRAKLVVPPLDMNLYIVRYHGADIEINRETPRTSMTLEFQQEPDQKQVAKDGSSQITVRLHQSTLADMCAIMDTIDSNALTPPLCETSENPFAWWQYFAAMKRERERQKYRRWQSVARSAVVYKRYKSFWNELSQKSGRGVSDAAVNNIAKNIVHAERYELTVTAIVNARSEVFQSYRSTFQIVRDYQDSNRKGSPPGSGQNVKVADTSSRWGMSWLFGESDGSEEKLSESEGNNAKISVSNAPVSLPHSLRMKSEDIASIGSQLVEANFLNIQFILDLRQLSLVAINGENKQIMIGKIGGVTNVKIYADSSWASEVTLRELEVEDPILKISILGRRFRSCMESDRQSNGLIKRVPSSGTALLSLSMTSRLDHSTENQRAGNFTVDLHLASMQVFLDDDCMSRIHKLLLATLSSKQRANLSKAAKTSANIVKEGLTEELHDLLRVTTSVEEIEISKKVFENSLSGPLDPAGKWNTDVFVILNAPLILVPLQSTSQRTYLLQKRLAIFDLGQFLVVHGQTAKNKMRRQSVRYKDYHFKERILSSDDEAWNVVLRSTQVLVVDKDLDKAWHEPVLSGSSPYHMFSSKEVFVQVDEMPLSGPKHKDGRQNVRCLALRGYSSHVLLQISAAKLKTLHDIIAMFEEYIDITKNGDDTLLLAHSARQDLGSVSKEKVPTSIPSQNASASSSNFNSAVITAIFELAHLQVTFEVEAESEKLEDAASVADASLVNTELNFDQKSNGDNCIRLTMSQLHIIDTSKAKTAHGKHDIVGVQKDFNFLSDDVDETSQMKGNLNCIPSTEGETSAQSSTKSDFSRLVWSGDSTRLIEINILIPADIRDRSIASCTFGSLSIEFNPETLAKIHAIIMDIGLEKASFETEAQSKSCKHEEENYKQPILNSQTASVPEALATSDRCLNVDINIHSICVNLNKPRLNRCVAQIRFIDGTICYKQDAHGGDCTTWSIGDICIEDTCSKGSVNRIMFGISPILEEIDKKVMPKGNTTRGCNITTFVEGSFTRSVIDPDDLERMTNHMDLQLHPGCRITYLNNWWDEMMDYLTNGIVAGVISSVTQAANSFTFEELTADQTNPDMRLTFALHASRPHIFIPCHAQTNKGIALVVGDLSCSNTVSLVGRKGSEPGVLHNLKHWDVFEESNEISEESEVYLEQEITTNLQNTWVQIHTGKHLTKTPVESINVFLHQVLEPMSAHLALDMHVSIQIPDSCILLSRDDYILAQSILVSNLGAPKDRLAAEGGNKIDSPSTDGENNKIHSVTSPEFAVQFEYGAFETLNRFVVQIDVDSLELDVIFLDDETRNISEESKLMIEIPLRFAFRQLGFKIDSSFQNRKRISAFIDNVNVAEIPEDDSLITGRCLFSAKLHDAERVSESSQARYKLISFSSVRISEVATQDCLHLQPFIITVHPTLVYSIIPLFSVEDEELIVPKLRRDTFLAEQEASKGSYELEIVMIEATMEFFAQHNEGIVETDKLISVISGDLLYSVPNPNLPEVNHLKITMSTFHCHRIDRNIPNMRHKMIGPTSAELLIHSGVREQKNYKFKCETLDIILTFRDYDLLQDIFNSWPDSSTRHMSDRNLKSRSNDDLEFPEQAFASSSDDEANFDTDDSDNDKYLLQKGTHILSGLSAPSSPSFSPLNFTSGSRQQSQKANTLEAHTPKFGVEISLKDCFLTIVDDLEGRYYPLLKMYLSHFSAFMNSIPNLGQQVAGVKVSAEVSYFDHKSKSWQQCTMNNGGLSMQLSYLHQTQNESVVGDNSGADSNKKSETPSSLECIDVSVNCEKIVRMQFTSAMIHSVNTSYKRWNEWQDQRAEKVAKLVVKRHKVSALATHIGREDRPLINVDTKNVGPFVIRNWSGVLASVQGISGVCAAGSQSLTSPHDLASGNEIYFRMIDSPRFEPSSSNNQKHSKSPSLQITMFGIGGSSKDISLIISLNSIGVHKFKLGHRNLNDQQDYIYVSLAEENGYTVVDLHSGMWIENKCSVFDLEVRFDLNTIREIPSASRIEDGIKSSHLIRACKRNGGRFYIPLNMTDLTSIQVRPRGSVLECKIPLNTSTLGVTLVPCRGNTGILVASIGNKKSSSVSPQSILERLGVKVGSELRCINGFDIHLLSFNDAFKKLKDSLKNNMHLSEEDAESNKQLSKPICLTFYLPMVVSGGVPMHSKFEWSAPASMHTTGSSLISIPWSSKRADLGVFLRIHATNLQSGMRALTFEPPLHVRNCLPQEATMRFVGHQGGTKYRHELTFPGGQEHEVYTVNTQKSLLAQLKMKGFICGKSEYMRLPSVFEQSQRRIHHIGLAKSQQQVLTKNITLHDITSQLPLDITLHAFLIGNGMRIDLRSSFWVVNQSGLPLEYRAGTHEHWHHWQHRPQKLSSSLIPPLEPLADTKPRLISYLGSSGIKTSDVRRRGSVGRASNVKPCPSKMSIRVKGTTRWSQAFNVGEAGSHNFVGVNTQLSEEKSQQNQVIVTCVVDNGPISFGLGSMRVFRVFLRHNIRLISSFCVWVRQVTDKYVAPRVRLEPNLDHDNNDPTPFFFGDNLEDPTKIKLCLEDAEDEMWSDTICIDNASLEDTFVKIKGKNMTPRYCCVSTEMFGVFQFVTTIRSVTESEYRKHYADLANELEAKALDMAEDGERKSSKTGYKADKIFMRRLSNLFNASREARKKSICKHGDSNSSTVIMSLEADQQQKFRKRAKSKWSIRCSIVGVIIELNKVSHAHTSGKIINSRNTVTSASDMSTHTFFKKIAELRVLQGEFNFDYDVHRQLQLCTRLERVAIIDMTSGLKGTYAFLCGGVLVGESRPAFLLKLHTASSHRVALHIKSCHVQTATIIIDTGESFFRELQFVLLQIRGTNVKRRQGQQFFTSESKASTQSEDESTSWSMLEYVQSLEQPWALLQEQNMDLEQQFRFAEQEISLKQKRQIEIVRRRLIRRSWQKRQRQKRFHLVRLDLFDLKEINVIFSFSRRLNHEADTLLVNFGGVALGDILGSEALEDMPPIEKVNLVLPEIKHTALGEFAAVQKQIANAISAALTKYIMSNLKMLLFQNPDVVINVLGTQARRLVGASASALGSVAVDVGSVLGGVLETGFSLATLGFFNSDDKRNLTRMSALLDDLSFGIESFPSILKKRLNSMMYSDIQKEHLQLINRDVDSLPFFIYASRSLTYSMFLSALDRGKRSQNTVAPWSINVLVLNCTRDIDIVITSAVEANPQHCNCRVVSLPHPIGIAISPNASYRKMQTDLSARSVPWDSQSTCLIHFSGNAPKLYLPSYNHTGPHIECVVRSTAFDLFIRADGSIDLADRGVSPGVASAQEKVGTSCSDSHHSYTVTSLASYQRYRHFAEYILMVGQRL